MNDVIQTAAVETPKNKGGRPKINLDPLLIGKLAEAGCSIDEIAAMLKRSGLKVDMRTIKRRLVDDPEYREEWLVGQLAGKYRLRSSMMFIANQRTNLNAAANMLQFLGRTHLGMSEKNTLEVNASIEVTSARERITRRIDDIAKRIEGRVAGIAAAAGAGTHSGEPVGS